MKKNSEKPRSPEEIKTFLSRREWSAYIYEINSNYDLYKVAKDANFLENPEDFQVKKQKLIYFDQSIFEEKVKKFTDWLSPQHIVLITGPPAVGKSTLLLAFLDKCLEEDLGDWEKILFLNPIDEYLFTTLNQRIIASILRETVHSNLEGLEELSEEDTLLVVDGLYREGEDEIRKIFELFKRVREERFRLIATLRIHELEELKRQKEWASFENYILIDFVKPNRKIIVPILMKLIRYWKNKFLQFANYSDEQLENYFRSSEFKGIANLIVDKSKGVPGYVAYLLNDLSMRGEFSKEVIEKCPKGLMSLIKRIVERDFKVEEDEVLPTITLFMTLCKEPLTWEFFKSFIRWGVVSVDGKDENFALRVQDKAKNLMKHYASKKEQDSIISYILITHWKDALKELSKREFEWREYSKHVRSRIKSFIAKIEEDLKNGTLTSIPDNVDAFVVIADVAKLLKEKEFLKYTHNFLKVYERSRFKDEPQYLFLKKTLIQLWTEQALCELEQKNYPVAQDFIENALELDPCNAYLHFLKSRCQLETENYDEAIKSCENAIKLEKKEEDIIEYRMLLSRIWEEKGETSENKLDFSGALSCYSKAKQIYNEALRIIERLEPIKRGRKKKQESRLTWLICQCNRKIKEIQRKYKKVEERKSLEDCEKLLKEGKNYLEERKYEDSLRRFNEAKVLALELVDSIGLQSNKLNKLHSLISEIYKLIGTCYEKMGKYELAANNYSIYLELNEYAPDSLDQYIKYGNKFKIWKLNEMARYCFWRALRKNPNNYFALTELADIEGRMGMFEFAVNHIKKILERSRLTAEVQQSYINLLSHYEEKIKIREDIGNKLINIINLSLSEEDPWKLSTKWYKIAISLDEISLKDILPADKLSNREVIAAVHEEIKIAKILCLWRALLSAKKACKKNILAIREMKKIKNTSIRDIIIECRKWYQEYFREAKKRNPLEGKMKSPITEILHHICFRAIFTQNFIYKQKMHGFKNKKEEEKVRKRLSGIWGWVGGQIRKINRKENNPIKISPNVAIRCFELSLQCNKRNKASSNGYAWALLDAQKYDRAIVAFESDLNINPNNPASITGKGIAFMKMQQAYGLALENLKIGAKMRFEQRLDEPPEEVLKQLKATIENLKDLASISINRKTEILNEALEVYKMIMQIMKEIRIDSKQLRDAGLYEDDQNLFLLEAWSLKNYIKNS